MVGSITGAARSCQAHRRRERGAVLARINRIGPGLDNPRKRAILLMLSDLDGFFFWSLVVTAPPLTRQA